MRANQFQLRTSASRADILSIEIAALLFAFAVAFYNNVLPRRFSKAKIFHKKYSAEVGGWEYLLEHSARTSCECLLELKECLGL